jgi:hypothetical protein
MIQGQTEARAYASDFFLLNEDHRATLMSGQEMQFTPSKYAAFMGRLIPSIIGLAFMAFPIVFVILQQQQIQEARQIDQGPREVNGRVTKLEIDSDSDGTDYYVSYQFRSTTDALFSARQKISASYYGTLKKDQAIRVRYYTQNPALSELVDSPRNRTFEVAPLIFLFVFFAIGACVLVVPWFSASEKDFYKQFNAEGALIIGRIQSISGTEDSDGDYQVKITYGFTDPTQKAHVKNYTAYHNEWKGKRLPSPQTPVLIAYLKPRQFRLL